MQAWCSYCNRLMPEDEAQEYLKEIKLNPLARSRCSKCQVPHPIEDALIDKIDGITDQMELDKLWDQVSKIR